jgi:hypothetical protein
LVLHKKICAVGKNDLDNHNDHWPKQRSRLKKEKGTAPITAQASVPFFGLQTEDRMSKVPDFPDSVAELVARCPGLLTPPFHFLEQCR